MDSMIELVLGEQISLSTYKIVAVLLVTPISYMVLASINNVNTPVLVSTTVKVDAMSYQDKALLEATQKLLNTSVSKNEIAIDTLTDLLWDSTPDVPQVGIVEGVLEHYNLHAQDYMVLSDHVPDIYNFNQLLHTHAFENPLSIDIWINQHSQFTYEIYSLICGVFPGA